MIIKTWSIEREFGYKPITTFYTDFSIADKVGGEIAVIDTFERAFSEWKENYKFLTELVMVLNWKIWEHYKSNDKLARVYQKLWEKAGDYAVKNLNGEELSYYYRTID